MSYTSAGAAVAHSAASERAAFIQRTYMHLAGAILAFVTLTGILLQMPFTENIVRFMSGHWWLVLVLFIGVGWIAQNWAMAGGTSVQTQYLGLGLYVVAEAFIFLPILYIAQNFASPDVIPAAGITTLGLFAGLTFVAFTSGKDFSFLGGFLKVAFLVALGVIFAQMIFNFPLSSTLFASVMVLLAGGAILYDTSNIMYHYRTDQHVAASLSLFASVALMFYYILMLFMSGDE